MSEPLAEEIFRTASETIDVLSAPVDGVVARSRELRRRRRRITIASVAAGAVVLAGLTWVGARSAPEGEPAPTGVTRSANPVDVAWYGDGKLHLANVAVELPPITDLVEILGGAVYADESNTVTFVDDSGARTDIGKKVPGTAVVGSSESGLAAWIAAGDDGPEILLYDVLAGRPVATQLLPSGTGNDLVALDRDRAYFTTADGDFVWTAVGGSQARAGHGLLDAGAGLRVYQRRDQIDIVQPFFNVTYLRAGRGAVVSPGGNYVLTAAPGGLTPAGTFRPLLYDARSGDRLATGLGRGMVAADATFGKNHGVIYLTAHLAALRAAASDGDGPPLLILRSCAPGGFQCHDVAPLSGGDGKVLLAH